MCLSEDQVQGQVHSWNTCRGEPELISVLRTAQFEHTASNVHACAAVGIAVCCACALGVMCHIHIDRYMWAVVMIKCGALQNKIHNRYDQFTSFSNISPGGTRAHHTEMHLVQHISMY